jgi:hypothetical protein
MHLIWQVNMYDPPVTLPEPKVINLLTDLKEERDVGAKNSCVGVPMTKIIIDLEQSLKNFRRSRRALLSRTFHPNKRLRIETHSASLDFAINTCWSAIRRLAH